MPGHLWSSWKKMHENRMRNMDLSMQPSKRRAARKFMCSSKIQRTGGRHLCGSEDIPRFVCDKLRAFVLAIRYGCRGAVPNGHTEFVGASGLGRLQRMGLHFDSRHHNTRYGGFTRYYGQSVRPGQGFADVPSSHDVKSFK